MAEHPGHTAETQACGGPFSHYSGAAPAHEGKVGGGTVGLTAGSPAPRRPETVPGKTAKTPGGSTSLPAISQLAVFSLHSGASPRGRTPCPGGRSLGRPSLRAGRVARFSKQNYRVPSKICNSGNNTLPFSVKCVPCHIWTHSPCLGWGSQTSRISPCGSRRARAFGVRGLSTCVEESSALVAASSGSSGQLPEGHRWS